MWKRRADGPGWWQWRWGEMGRFRIYYKYIDPIRFSDGLDAECEKKKEALRIKLCVLVLYCFITNYPKLTEL